MDPVACATAICGRGVRRLGRPHCAAEDPHHEIAKPVGHSRRQDWPPACAPHAARGHVGVVGTIRTAEVGKEGQKINAKV